MFALVRTIIYTSLLVGAALLYLPVGEWFGFGSGRPGEAGVQQIAGMMLGTAGVVLALSCALFFAVAGRGTPLPFDPPRKLVTEGPYRFTRNPMAVGVGAALAGASLYYESWSLLGFTALFFLFIHLMVVFYEEPTLRASFGDDYVSYCKKVGRWWPKVGR